MMDDLVGRVIGGRVWPDREHLTLAELLKGIEAILEAEPRLTIVCRMWGSDHGGRQSWSVVGDLSVDGYVSSEEVRRLAAICEPQGFYLFFSDRAPDEGHIRVAFGSHSGQRTNPTVTTTTVSVTNTAVR